MACQEEKGTICKIAIGNELRDESQSVWPRPLKDQADRSVYLGLNLPVDTYRRPLNYIQ